MKTQFHRATTTVVWILALFAAPMLLAFDSTPYPGPHPPDGSAAYPWKIDRPQDFDAIGTDGIHLAGHHYVLIKNIDCGNQDHRIRVDFSGSLDGGYHRISRIRVDQPDEMYGGLVANMISPSTIRRLGIVDSFFRARDAAGSIAGAMAAGTLVEECLSQGNTIIAVSGNGQGGIVGASSSLRPAAVVRNSYSRDNSVSSGFQTVGGICGYNDALIERCYSAGNTLTALNYLGGLVGYQHRGTAVYSYSHLTNSPAVQVGSAGGTWQNALVPDRYTSNFDITLYSIAQLNWDPAVWTKGADNYPVLVGFSNQPPVCDAGVNWEIATSDQADIEITGTASDADLDPLQYRWLAGATVLLDWTAVTENGHAPLALGSLPSFPIGTHTLTLEVTDMLATVFDEMLLTVKEPGPWHFVLAGGKPVKLVWQTQIGEVYNLLLSDDLAAWTTADGFPKTATATTMEFAFVATERGFFKIVPISAGFSLIPAGSFTMGRTSGDTDTDAPPVNVYVSEFYMAQHEVTKALWDEVRAWGLANGYTDLPAGWGRGPEHPILTVTWWDVVKWCNARSERDGLTPVYSVGGNLMKTGTADPTADWSANGYRLPTEAEWEKAARGGVAGWRFPWGDEITHSHANYYSSSDYGYDISPTRGYHPTYLKGTSPVGSFDANGYGLYGMAGNVEEWCWDWYSASSYTDEAREPRGPVSGSDRVLRGGSWSYGHAFYCRAASRHYAPPDNTFGSVGFRPARGSSGFSLIPAGSFTMGRTSGDTAPNAPPVNVYVSAFHMAQYEVTKALWDEVRAWGLANGYSDLPAGGGKGPEHPVHNVNWWGVVKWCNARSERDGLTPVYTNGGDVMRTGTTAPLANWSANGYRLPTEAEWEKAARGGVSGLRFPWGDTITHSQANFWNSDGETYQSGTIGPHPSYSVGTMPYTSPVGSFAPNGYGLYDMAGNVWEWCWDRYSSSTYTEGASDPKGPVSGSSARVSRGGGWIDAARFCRSAHRDGFAPANSLSSFGFRPARSSVP